MSIGPILFFRQTTSSGLISFLRKATKIGAILFLILTISSDLNLWAYSIFIKNYLKSASPISKKNKLSYHENRGQGYKMIQCFNFKVKTVNCNRNYKMTQ